MDHLLISPQERALILAWEDYEKSRWDAIAQGMLSHGCNDMWTKEAVQRKWNEMHHVSYISEYELMSRSRGQKRVYQQASSDERGSVGHSFHESDTSQGSVSTVTMDQVRSGTVSDSSSQMQFYRQQQDS